MHYLEASAALRPLSCMISTATLQHFGVVVVVAGAGATWHLLHGASCNAG